MSKSSTADRIYVVIGRGDPSKLVLPPTTSKTVSAVVEFSHPERLDILAATAQRAMQEYLLATKRSADSIRVVMK